MTDQQYQSTDFVYVDPETRTVVGKVEWDKDGEPVSKKRVMKERPIPEGKPARPGPPRKPRERNYPWGSFRSMCGIFKLLGKGKDKETEGYITLDDAISKSMEHPYWD